MVTAKKSALTTPSAPIINPWSPGTPPAAVKSPEQIAAENQAKLSEWYKVSAELNALKAKELGLRNDVVNIYFGGIDNLKEGVNKVPMPEKWVLKATGKLNRNVDEAAIPAVKIKLKAMGVAIDNLLVYKPEVKTSLYRELTAEQQKVFDECLEIKPGTPQVELVLPKR